MRKRQIMTQKTAFDWRDEPSIYQREPELRRHVAGVQSANTRTSIKQALQPKNQSLFISC